ncbi:MAG: glycosyltransferase [Chitinispirillaceae bacterium]
MFSLPITLLFTVFLLIYSIAILVFTFSVSRIPPRPSAPPTYPGVSVIIPFRNEEHNLTSLLLSLKNQNYKGQWEIIMVDDHSTDAGAEIIRNFQKEFSEAHLRLIKSKEVQNRLTSKQQALETGVSEAVHPLLAFTDADMILQPQWLENLVNTQQSSGKNLVFGHTVLQDNDQQFMRIFESFQLEFLFSFAYAFSRMNLTGSCMGNNLLIDKECYRKSGGQKAIGYNIVEDRALLDLVRRKGFRTGAAEPFVPLALTLPSRSPDQFYNQMRRWAAGGCNPKTNLFAAGILFSAQNLLFLFSILGFMPLLISTLSYTNFFLNWLFLYLAFKRIHSPLRAYLFPLYYILLIAETIILGLSLIFSPRIEWKSRTVK